jgi:hypothetical protein
VEDAESAVLDAAVDPVAEAASDAVLPLAEVVLSVGLGVSPAAATASGLAPAAGRDGSVTSI